MIIRKPKVDLTGQLFGRLLVIKYYYKGYWHCQCECKKEKLIYTTALTTGKTKSCGCLAVQALKRTSTWYAWRYMKTVISQNPKIKICRDWDNYGSFLRDMGSCPEGMSLLRVDSDWHFEPENCRWGKLNDASCLANN
jgi:hypothetical protein